MSLPINHGKNLRRQFLNKQLSTTNINYDSWLSEKQKANVKKWISYYRRNWDLFCEQVLQIKLYPLQKFSLHMAGVANEYFEIATRGAAKSLRCPWSPHWKGKTLRPKHRCPRGRRAPASAPVPPSSCLCFSAFLPASAEAPRR